MTSRLYSKKSVDDVPQPGWCQRFCRLRLPLAWLLLTSGVSAAEPSAANTDDSNWLDIDQLSQIKITSASKRPEAISNVPAAVHVLTGDDILRSGATSIPEALRYVPGLNVAQINGSAWGIGARGYQAQFAPKLLVMVDGRSVYTPFFGGVYWDVQDYFLEDLEQIEVVMGPGGSIWGANAVNGVVNVITKSAKDTQGALLYGGGGSEKLGMAGARYGWELGKTTFARAYMKYGATDDTITSSRTPAGDSMQVGQSGFRIDGYQTDQAHWTLQGDGYAGRETYRVDLPTLTAPGYLEHSERPTDISGANLLGRWETSFSAESTLRLQAYYDYVERAGSTLDGRVHTADIEAHHTVSLGERHRLDWGLDYRAVREETRNAWVSFPGDIHTSQLYSGFVQDEMWLARDVLSLASGVKLEHNDYTGLEPQPNARLSLHPVERQMIWAGWSKAARVPTLVENEGSIDARVFPPGVFDPALPAVLRVLGNDRLQSEEMMAWELGWRWQATPKVSFDVSGYYFQFDQLILAGGASPYAQASPVPALILPAPFENGLKGDAFGGELSTLWQPLERWRLRASYGYVNMNLNPYRPDPFNYKGDEETMPHHTASLRSSVSLGRNWDFDTGLRYVDQVPFYSVSGYVELDARLAWRPRPNLEVALTGQNLVHSQHLEYKPSLVGRAAEIERGVYAKVTWKF